MAAKFVDELCRTGDFIPSLVGRFVSTSPSSVTIEVWDITGGVNVALILLNNTVSQIGNTESWIWSMENMPIDQGADGCFLFRMTADTGDIITREVIVKTISDGKWKYT